MSKNLRIGMIGLGTVGGTLDKWFKEHTTHHIARFDPAKGHTDNLGDCDAVFVSIPVESVPGGQDIGPLSNCVSMAKKHSQNVFIRSTVLPGTNDLLNTISMPEFLTARHAYEDMCRLPVVVGPADKYLLDQIMPGKEKLFFSNKECELAKFTHNCFGAMKVTYFNFIHKMCEHLDIKYWNVKQAANITGFLGTEHLQVPGPDENYGYGGTCFPVNMSAMQYYLEGIERLSSYFEKNYYDGFKKESEFFKMVIEYNDRIRNHVVQK